MEPLLRSKLISSKRMTSVGCSERMPPPPPPGPRCRCGRSAPPLGAWDSAPAAEPPVWGLAAGDSILLPVGIAVCRKTWFSQITGVEVPLPGTFTFHFTFFVSPHSVGGSPAGETPFINGPRHAGQFWSADDAAAENAARTSNAGARN